METNYEEVKALFLDHKRMSQEIGFDFVDRSYDKNINSEIHLKFINNGTIHYNKHYNSQFPETKGKVEIYVNLDYGTITKNTQAYCNIEQDGGTRTVYKGIIPSIEFLKQLLYSIR